MSPDANSTTTEPTTAEKIRSLPWVIGYDTANMVFCHLTVFGALFPLFLRELAFSKTQIGALRSLMPFCGPVALLIAPLVARAGFKRVFIGFWAMRQAAVAMLLLAPLMLHELGRSGAFLFVAGIMLGFALFRAVGETAFFPWRQEYVPNAIRGKFQAIDNSLMRVVSIVAVAAAGYVIGHSADISRFLWLIAAGLAFGTVSLTCAVSIPGGAPVANGGTGSAHLQGMRQAVGDRDFLLFLGGIGLVMLTFGPTATFVPLFLSEQIGLSKGDVVLLQAASLLGGLVTCYLWGWAADRFGSKPVMVLGLSAMVIVPVGWLLMPRSSVWSLPAAVGVGFFSGLATMGYLIGANRQLFVNAVPPEKKSEYMAVYYAWIGLFGGVGPLLAGPALDACSNITGHLAFLQVDQFTPLFAAIVLLRLLAMGLLGRLRSEGEMPTGQFAAMFLRGNPIMALDSVVRYNLAKDEPARIAVTERLGKARSPLNVDELIEALSDPSFNVRYEAIISIGRTRPDARLTQALLGVLTGGEPDLGVAAASALGRLGDASAVPPLRDALKSSYPLLRARAARALAALGDEAAAPKLLELFRRETHPGVRLAYASALGALRCDQAARETLALLRTSQDKAARAELALGLARIVGDEHYFVRLCRRSDTDIGTAASQAVRALIKKIQRLPGETDKAVATAERCAGTLALDDLAAGAKLLARLIAELPLEGLGQAARLILTECRARLDEPGPSGRVYLVLALHALDAALV